MSCPTCSATLQTVIAPAEAGLRVAWCPRCGTLCIQSLRRDGTVADSESGAPMLVGRCRRFEVAYWNGTPAQWKALGIAEAIHLPEDRP